MIMTDTYIMRRMQPQDVDSVATMEQRIFTDAWSREAFAREIAERNSMPTVICDEEGALLAYMIAWFVADEAHLGNIAVSPSMRRRGLAQRLLDGLQDQARTRGTVSIFLEVRVSNKAAQELYEGNGFKVISIRKRYYVDNREDALVMRKLFNGESRENN